MSTAIAVSGGDAQRVTATVAPTPATKKSALATNDSRVDLRFWSVADRLGLDPAEVTRAVTDVISRDGDALGRLQRRNRRADIDRGATTTPATTAQLARTDYPAPLRAVAPVPSAAADVHTGAGRPALAAQQRAAARSR
jgi:hypothetical protein